MEAAQAENNEAAEEQVEAAGESGAGSDADEVRAEVGDEAADIAFATAAPGEPVSKVTPAWWQCGRSWSGSSTGARAVWASTRPRC